MVTSLTECDNNYLTVARSLEFHNWKMNGCESLYITTAVPIFKLILELQERRFGREGESFIIGDQDADIQLKQQSIEV